MFFSIPWYVPKSETIKLNSCRNLIKHYLGDFLEKLTVEQLSVNLYNGTGTVSDVTLDCDALNKLGEDENWPLEVVKGHMEDITVTVPWSNVFKEESILKVDGLSLTLQPKIRTEPEKSFLKWVVLNWPKLSSKQLFMLKNKKTNGFERVAEQEEKIFADSIEAILKRLKVKLENTKVRIEHLPKHMNRGFALDVYIRSIDCYDEAISDFLPLGTDIEQSKTYVSDSYIKKKIKIEGVTLYTEEFHINRNSLQYRDNFQAPQRYKIDYNVNKYASDCVLHKMKNDILKAEPKTVKDINLTQSPENIGNEKSNPLGPIMFAVLNGQQELTLSLKKSDTNEGLSFAAETFGPLVILLSQKQLNVVIDLLNSLKKTQTQNTR